MNQTYPIFKKDIRLTAGEWVERAVLALVFITLGGLIYLVFSPLRPLLDPVPDYLGRLGLIVFFLEAIWLMRRSARFEKYTSVIMGLLIMTVAVSLDWIFSTFMLDTLHVDSNTPMGFAIMKINECVIVVGTVVLLTRLSGGSLGSIFIQKGNLKLGLTIGLIAFVIAAAGSFPMASLLFKGDGLTLAAALPWIPWLLLFVFANAAQEELLFRGLFLRKLQPFFGKFLSNFMIMFIFTFLHYGTTYSSDERIFLAVLVPVALAWGYAMQKTEGVWGSILFHAGMDIPIMLGIFWNLG